MNRYEFYFICIFYIIAVVGHLNGMNAPPLASAGQQQVHAISNNGICMLAQRIVQMMQAYGTEKLTKRNGTNFWDQFFAMVFLIASCTKVYIYVYISK